MTKWRLERSPEGDAVRLVIWALIIGALIWATGGKGCMDFPSNNERPSYYDYRDADNYQDID